MISLASHGLVLCFELGGPRHGRDRRRELAYQFIHHLVSWTYRIADWVLPERRHAMRQRRSAIAALAARPGRTLPRRAAVPELFEATGESAVVGLRFAIFIPSFLRGQGGAEKVAGQVAAVLADAGGDVDLFCREPTGPPALYSVPAAVDFRLLDERDDEAIRAWRSRDYDLVIGFGMAHFYRRIATIAELLDAPYVLQECTNPAAMTRLLERRSDAHSKEESYWLRQAVLAQAAAVRFTTPGYAATVEPDIEPCVYPFYNAFRHLEAASRGAAADPARRFICVGAMKNINKNGIAAIRAYCHGGFEEDWELTLYGQNNFSGETERTLQRWPNARVRDAGVERDIEAIYADAWALVIPSYEEGLPNVVVEAFSFGVPCIGFSDCAGVQQLIRHGESGLLVDREDPEQLTAAMRAIADPATRERLAAGARDFAARYFNYETWRRNWLRVAHNAAHGLDRRGDPAVPVARRGDHTAGRWLGLLETYRAIS
ncbi:MAG: glycosyltransferase [Gammaproteobacteria bacterium]